MRVLFLSQIVPYPPHGGVLQRGYNLIREIGSRAEVHLLAFVHPDVLPTAEAIDHSRTSLLEFCDSVEYFGLWAKGSRLRLAAALATSAWSSDPFGVVAHRSQRFRSRVEACVQSGRFDVVHADTIALSQFVDTTGPVPSVLTHHNVESSLMQRRAEVERRWLARRYLHREARKLRRYEADQCPRFDVNILMSTLDRDRLTELAPGVRTAVVPNGVDTTYFAPDGTSEEQALVYVGGMNMLANRDAVLHFLDSVWPVILRQAPRTQFFVVGQDPPPELIARAQADGRIVVTGYVEDVRPSVRKAAVFVVPLRVGGGTRLKVLDAMAMGKAIVSTSIGCEGLAVVPDRDLIVADQPQAMASSVLALLRDQPRRRQLGEAARTLVSTEYAWKAIGTSLLDAYTQAVSVKAAR